MTKHDIGKPVINNFNNLTEKLAKFGVKNLTDTELLAVILGGGRSKANDFMLAEQVIDKVDQISSEISINELNKIKGLKVEKAMAIAAGLEFSRRRVTSDGIRIKDASDVMPLIQHLAEKKQETFICVSLSGAHEVIAKRVVTIGLVNLCQVHPREVFADPIMDRACSVIVAHNHPSGDLTPSDADIKVTKRLKEAAQILGINLLDHIIFSNKAFRSINDNFECSYNVSVAGGFKLGKH